MAKHNAMIAPKKEDDNDQEQRKIESFEYNMTSHARQCVERYCELANVEESSLRRAITPCIDDHHIDPEDFQAKGKLQNYINGNIYNTSGGLVCPKRDNCGMNINFEKGELH